VTTHNGENIDGERSVLDHYVEQPVVVTGCASGIGAAVAKTLIGVGSRVIGIDLKQPDFAVHQFIPCDLRDRFSIEIAVSSLPNRVWALFNCAGLSSGASDSLTVVRVNFLGLRELLEAIEPRIPSGGAIVSTASAAGRDYRDNSSAVLGLVRSKNFVDGEDWMREHEHYIQARGGYRVSKEAVVLYTMASCWRLGKRGIRINALAPGVTDTPMLEDFAREYGWGPLDNALEPLGRRASAEEQARILIFLNSRWASFVNGQTIWSDGGAISADEIQHLADTYGG
jgi:NAD(P)-dependent dehydrogenase (short-subunit alcohol dehydrogenase family)